MKTIKLTQGSEEWHTHRASHYNASDAPAMMGVSKYRTRDQLIEQYATGVTPEVDSFTQSIFDKGHRFEALARPIAERILGEILSPVTGVLGEYSASFDGLTFDGAKGWEHKTLNDEIRRCDFASDLHMMYRVQMEQQHMISGANETLFSATNWDGEGNLIEEAHFNYKSDLELRRKIIDGWSQFEIDVASYKPAPVTKTVMAVAAPSMPLPMVSANGDLTESNLPDIIPQLSIYLKKINTELTTDQHFADATEAAKECRLAAKKFRGAAESIIEGMPEVFAADRALRQGEKELDAMGLRLEKLIKAEKELIKKSCIVAAQDDYLLHYHDADSRVNGVTLDFVQLDFASAIKGVRTVESMQSRVRDLLASGKAELTGKSKEITEKLEHINKAIKGRENLFDKQLLVQNDIEHIKLHIKAMIDGDDERIEKLAAEKIASEAAKAAVAASTPVKPYEIPLGKPASTPHTTVATANHAASITALEVQLAPYCKSKKAAKILADDIAQGRLHGISFDLIGKEVAA